MEAAAAGQHSIEHLTGTPSCETDSCSNPAARTAIAAFLEHGTWHDPTIAVYEAMLGMDDRSFTHNERRQ